MDSPERIDRKDAVKPLMQAINAAAQRGGFVAPWVDLIARAHPSLDPAGEGPAWTDRLAELATRLRQLMDQDADAGLYMMLQTAMTDIDHYSASHALHCAVVAHLCAAWFEWPIAESNALLYAALTMNVGMTEVQDSLARQDGPPTFEQRRSISDHPVKSVELLTKAGVSDALWLETVRRHHRPIGPSESEDASLAPQRLAQLLHRIDVFTAKLSRRKARFSVSAIAAARDACLDDAGTPDANGATMLRVLGLYPPGSYVRLINGEIGVVTLRGAKAHTPVVAILARANGAMISQPHLRDTAVAEFLVQRSLSPADMKIGVVHERTLGARWVHAGRRWRKHESKDLYER